MDQKITQSELTELIAQCQAGSGQAKERLVLQIQNRVYYYCLKMLHNPEDALDATQDILIAVLEGLNTLRKPESFYPWLRRIIARTCMEACAREPLLTESGDGRDFLESYEDLDEQTVPEKALDNEETRQMIAGLVDALPGPQRLCVLMYYYDEMRVREIAAALEISENTVKSRLNYARKTIKEGLDAYLAKGGILCAFPPLSYLQYFLQQEAVLNNLRPEMAETVGKAVLAAGVGVVGAAAASAGGGGITAVGVTIAMTKVGGGVLVQKGLAALAGVALAGGLGGGIVLHSIPAAVPDVPDPAPPAIVEMLTPSKPEETDPLPLVIEGAAGENGAAFLPQRGENASRPAGSGSSPADREHSAGPETDTGGSVSQPDPDPLPETPPELLPETPEPPETPETPEVPAVPEVPEVPEEPAPLPVQSLRPNPEYGQYLGLNSDGIHEFSLTLRPNEELRKNPFLDGRYTRLEISDPERVSSFAQYIKGLVPGSCEVRYYESDSPQGPFTLAAVVYVTIEPVQPITPDYDWGGYEKTDSEGVAYFAWTLRKGEMVYRIPLEHGDFYVRAESSDPAVVRATSNSRLIAEGYGTAEIRYYTRWAMSDSWQLSVVVQVTVPDPSVPVLPPPQETIVRQETSLPYGARRDFAALWDGELPEGLTYTSSNPGVVWVEESGRLTTLTPGSVVVTAKDPDAPEVRYALTVQVEDAFAWTYRLEDLTLQAGETLEQRLTCELEPETVLSSVRWSSRDPLIADVEPVELDSCRVRGAAEGEAEVEAALVFQVPTPRGLRTMEETVSFRVCVEPPSLPEGPTILSKELTQFGYCSGYGCTGYFNSRWREELPEDAELVYISSDPSVVYVGSDGFYETLSSGSAVLTAWDPDAPETRYALTIQVQDRYDWFYEMKDVEIPVESSGGYQIFSYGLNSRMKILKGEWTSSDPDVVQVVFGTEKGCQIQGWKPGSAVITGRLTFRFDGRSGSRLMYDTISFRVDVDYEMETEVLELTDFGYCSGYGFTGSFADFWPDMPLEGMDYGSNDHSVVIINEKGEFTALKAGKAVLTAEPPDQEGVQYAIAITVQDRFDWRYSLEPLTMELDTTVLHGVTEYETADGTTISYVIWLPVEYERLGVVRDPDNFLLCHVTAKRPGLAEVEGRLTFLAKTCNGTQGFYESIFIPVTVTTPEEDGGTSESS